MEVLSFLRLLWRPTATVVMPDGPRDSTAKTDYGSDDEDDSFFELELVRYVTDSDSEDGADSSAATFLKSNGIKQTSPAETKARDASCCFSADKPAAAASLSLSPTPPFSKRKVLPMESASQPQSPISLFKSSPKLRVLMFRRSRSKSVSALNVKAEETEETGLKNSARGNVFFPSKSREAQPAPPATDDASKKQNKNKQTPSPSSRGKLGERFFSDDSNSKQLSKDGLQKYLNLVKPLSVGVSKRFSDTVKFPLAESPLTSPASSPSTAAVSSPRMGKGLRVRPKHLLGKSKSATLPTPSVTSSPARRDDSLVQQHDGIQGAILHCKKSYYSSRDGSVLWRSASDPSSHGKSADSI